MTAEKSRRLGRGLEALLASKGAAPVQAEVAERSALQRIPLAQIRANPYQPRKEFRPEELADLEASLKASGLLQPITVRTAPSGGGYELIAGERRLRAATRLGWTEIPAVVHQIDDRTLLTLALVENLQRADLNPIEEGEGYQRLIQEFSLTQQQVADAVGKDRSTVANMLRLLNLPTAVRRMLQQGELTLGHARALLAVGDERRMLELAREVTAKGLTVRDVEARARDGSPPKARASRTGQRGSEPPAQVKRLESELRAHLQTDVHISLAAAERGSIAISFYSADDLERILDLVIGAQRERS